MLYEDITSRIIVSAINVHSELGPGLLESAYHACMIHELSRLGVGCRSQKLLPVHFRGIEIDAGYRLDLLVQDRMIVELKAVSRVLPIHKAQLLTYLKLSQKRVGLLINFNETRLKDGLVRMVNG